VPRPCEQDYENINKKLSKYEGLFIVDFDASLQGAGGVLSQIQSGQESDRVPQPCIQQN